MKADRILQGELEDRIVVKTAGVLSNKKPEEIREELKELDEK
jgi:hypothetical protein